MRERCVELLAPAKDCECGRVAVDCGADAVYIGGPRFGARERAANQLADIEKLCAYAHKYWARVYVTVNTLLRDDEIDEAVRLIWDIHGVGADAVIIQDVGLLMSELPPIALIASTQMHNDTPERVKFLEEVGFTRVILARELSIEEIRAIRRAAPKIEMETFVHGALCVCYSGQCYWSYARGGRSGNRGACAQPCRLRYTLVDRDGRVLAGPGHLLSLKDLNLTDYLGELVDAGVTSFKIEGRLKEREYVMNTVAWYRRELDKVIAAKGLARASSGECELGFSPDVVQTFNRGYTSYFIHGRGAGVNEPRTPKWIGEEIGVVRQIVGRRVELVTKQKLANGDGLSYFSESGELCGMRVNRVDGKVLEVSETGGLRVGMSVYRNYNHEFMKQLTQARPRRKIGVWFEVSSGGSGVMCRVRDEDGVEATVERCWGGREGVGRVEVEARVRRQFEKCGGTVFEAKGVRVECQGGRLPTVAEINAARRALCEALVVARERARPRMQRREAVEGAMFPARVLDMRGNVTNQRAAAFYQQHGVEVMEWGGDRRESLEGERVMTTRYCPLRERGICVQQNSGVRARQPLRLVDDEGGELELRCNAEKCEMEYVLRQAPKRVRTRR